jgi:uncharacterized protein (DUF1684 family)
VDAAETDAHRASVEAWRERRYASLRRPIGWLTLAGLEWLAPGDNRIGTDPANEIVLPDGPPIAGVVHVAGERVSVDAGPAAALAHDGRPARDLDLIADVDAPDDAGPTMLTLGRLRICLIRRADRLALRIWDTETAALHEFGGVPHYPVDPAWRIVARLEVLRPPAHITVPDVLGIGQEEVSPGSVAFEYDGAQHRLQALEGGPNGELWLIFADTTNGHETYGGGRYLYTDPPDADATVVVDFNRAYNPPCVFTPYATCPLPWPANRLPFAVEAGERLPAGR